MLTRLIQRTETVSEGSIEYEYEYRFTEYEYEYEYEKDKCRNAVIRDYANISVATSP